MIEKLLLLPIRGEKVPNGHSAPAGTRAGLVAMTQLLILHLACRDWVEHMEGAPINRFVLAIIYSVSLLLSLGGSWELRSVLGRSTFNAARWIALAAVSFKLLYSFPLSSNHLYVEMFAVLFLTLTELDEEDQQLAALAALRWLPAIILIWSGLQKVLYGTYFDGAYLAYVSGVPKWAAFFDMVLPAEELQSLGEQERDGPFRFHTATAILMANLAYIGEITVGILLLIRKTRPLAFCAACGLVLAIELGAREVLFGLLIFSLLLLYLDARWLVRWRWLAICIYGYLLLAAAKVVPGGGFN